MTLDKHQIDGISGFPSRTMQASSFEQLMQGAGYEISGSAPAQGDRHKIWWTHKEYHRVESIYSPDKKIVITAYHVEA
jgi:hypothetical protein